MATRYRDEWHSKTWDYPADVDAFLVALRVNVADVEQTRIRVDIFMATPVAKRMPNELREALIAAGWLNAPRESAFMVQRR